MFGLVSWIDRTAYPQFAGNWDDSLLRERILSEIRPGSNVLDLGAGAGILPQMDFRGLGATIYGADLDPRVVDNPYLHDGRVATAERLPYEDGTFDIIFANNVLEHLPDPDAVFAEVARVLRKGGVFLFKTPNRNHYVPTLARLTSHRFHEIVAKLRGRAEEDTFPTLYRANSAAAIAKLAQAACLGVDRLERIEGRPEYLRISAPTYLLGLVYERIVNSTEALAGLRVLLVGRLRKPA